MECCSSPSEKYLEVLWSSHLGETPVVGLVLDGDLATTVANVAALLSVL